MNQRHLFNSYNITDEVYKSKIEDFTITNGRDLLSPYRIDLVAKFIYINSIVLETNTDYSKKLYEAHISAFTHGNYKEQGQELNKAGIESFYKIFDQLISDIQQDGFDETVSRIPLDRHGILLDGAHRTAVCAYFEKLIPVSKFNIIGNKYGYEFFRDRMLKPKYLDFIIHSYINIKEKDLYTLCLWPTAYEKRNTIKDFLKNNFTLVYEKEIKLNARGAHSFISQIYSHHDWVGTAKNGFKGSRTKVSACFDFENPLVLFVLETKKTLNEIIELKENIRTIIGLGKHSVHITDNQHETEQIAELLLNHNSIYHLNHANAFKYDKGVERFFKFKEALEKGGHDRSEVIIDGSGSMEVFGLREADDIDFISNQNIVKTDYYSNRTEAELYKLYDNDIDVLQSPDSYFYFFGIKFLTLKKVFESKKRRGEAKDVLDAKIVENFLKSNDTSSFTDFVFLLKRKKMNAKSNFKRFVGKILKRLGIFSFLKKLIGIK